MKNNKRTTRNCKDGLTNLQEINARRIRKELLTQEGKQRYYEELHVLWNDFICGDIIIAEFDDYVRLERPELHSAFKRLGINILDIIENFLTQALENL